MMRCGKLLFYNLSSFSDKFSLTFCYSNVFYAQFHLLYEIYLFIGLVVKGMQCKSVHRVMVTVLKLASSLLDQGWCNKFSEFVLIVLEKVSQNMLNDCGNL